MSVAAERLRSFVQRIERLEEDKAGIVDDIRVVYAEAKSESFDVKTMRKVIARRRKGEQTTREEDEILELYESAIGGQAELPFEPREPKGTTAAGVHAMAREAFGEVKGVEETEAGTTIHFAGKGDGGKSSLSFSRAVRAAE